MKVLLDASVVLRRLFGEPDALEQWSQIDEAYASRLMPVELGRVIDRARLAGDINDVQVEHLVQEAQRVTRSVEILDLSEAILARATGPMPTAIGTLDAAHLATALELAPTIDGTLIVATHDAQLARAARASGLEVIGVRPVAS